MSILNTYVSQVCQGHSGPALYVNSWIVGSATTRSTHGMGLNGLKWQSPAQMDIRTNKNGDPQTDGRRIK
jgi:hypothetical protein